MATYTIHFSEEESRHYYNALQYYYALDDMYQLLRRIRKYEELETAKEREIVDRIEKEFHEILSERNLEIP